MTEALSRGRLFRTNANMGLHLLCGLLTASGPTDGNPITHKFHATVEKHTVLSASCAAVWDVACEVPSQVTIVAPTSLLWPFMDHGTRAALSSSLVNHKQNAPAQYLPHTSPTGNQISTTLHLPATDTPSHSAPTGTSASITKHKTSVSRGTESAMLCLPCNLQGFLILPAAAAALEGLLSDVRCAAGTQTEWNYAWGLASVPSTQPATRVPAHQRIAHAITSALGGQQTPMPLPSSISACLAVLTAMMNSPVQAAQAVQAVQKQAVQLMRRPAAAVLGCDGLTQEPALLPGRKVLVMGSPFGCLAPHHFANSCMQGVVSMIPDAGMSHNDNATHIPMGSVLFTIDAPCLPGMEGGLVHAGDTGGQACVLGMLCLPLSRASDGVQIQVALNMQYVLTALARCGQVSEHLLQPTQQQHPVIGESPTHATGLVSMPLPAVSHSVTAAASHKAVTTSRIAQPPATASPHHSLAATQQVQPTPCSGACSVAHAMRSVVLVRTQHSWATGVIISPGGLVLTNAHLLLPGVASGQQARAALRHAASQYGHSLRHAEVLARADTQCTDGDCDPMSLQPVADDGSVEQAQGIPIPGRGRHSLHKQHEVSTSDQCPKWGMEGVLERQLCRLNFRGGSGSPGSSGHGLMRRHTSASCMVRLGLPGQQVRWCAAHTLYIWTNHLDLAVLQLQLPDNSSSAGIPEHGGIPHVELMQPVMAPAGQRPLRTAAQTDTPSTPRRRNAPTTAAAVAPAACSSSNSSTINTDKVAATRARSAAATADLVQPPPCKDVPPMHTAAFEPVPACTYGSMPVYVVGHGLVGPAAGWPAAVTAGNVAQVVHAHGKPCMLITTATVHAGASGGAVLDACGRLVALVTSNARHASGHTLPNLNFCIPAEALQPVVAALLRHEQRRGDAAASHTHKDWTSSLDVLLDVHASRQLLREDLDALDVSDPGADRVWNLEGPPPAPPWPGAGTTTTTTPAAAAAAVTATAACSKL